VSLESPRIAELRRRVQADPASIAFAQLAEEYRRAGNYEEAVKYCRAGLARHPGYLSARVTLGRALSETGGLDEAAREFELVLKSAPENLAAIRGLAEIHQRRGDMAGALEYYKRALALARFDPDLEETVNRINREMGAVTSAPHSEGLSFEQATSEFLSAASRTPAPGASASAPGGATADKTADRPGAPGAANAPRPDLIDFDALLASLGVPDASPPPIMEMLLKEPAVQAPRPEPVVPELPVAMPMEQAFADLERELRAFDDAPPAPSPEAAVAAVVEELESWMRVLQNERPTQNG
jgi:tetratricopeptide (TPR) repeat protein